MDFSFSLSFPQITIWLFGSKIQLHYALVGLNTSFCKFKINSEEYFFQSLQLTLLVDLEPRAKDMQA